MSHWRPLFNPRPVLGGYEMEKVAMEHVFYEYVGIPVTIFPPPPSPSALHNHSYIIGDLQSLYSTASLNNINLNRLSCSPGTLNGQSVTLVAAKDKTEEIISDEVCVQPLSLLIVSFTKAKPI
jgi:hypothetical protein